MNKLKIFITLTIFSLLAFEIYESFNIHNHRDEPGDLVLDNKDLRKSVDSIKYQPSLVFQSRKNNCNDDYNKKLKEITKKETATKADYISLSKGFKCASCIEKLKKILNDENWSNFDVANSESKYNELKCN
jgi:hypothetical protein